MTQNEVLHVVIGELTLLCGLADVIEKDAHGLDQLHRDESVVQSEEALESLECVLFAEDVKEANLCEASLHELLAIDNELSQSPDDLHVKELIALGDCVGLHLIKHLQESPNKALYGSLSYKKWSSVY